mmetsp:Transcript_16585/g.36694  ORF Transcript_16585/g.36694 Transcript_16585/m.36694 type:complete len:203 (+) Transcript_16585:1085-1693(+)
MLAKAWGVCSVACLLAVSARAAMNWASCSTSTRNTPAAHSMFEIPCTVTSATRWWERRTSFFQGAELRTSSTSSWLFLVHRATRCMAVDKLTAFIWCPLLATRASTCSALSLAQIAWFSLRQVSVAAVGRGRLVGVVWVGDCSRGELALRSRGRAGVSSESCSIKAAFCITLAEIAALDRRVCTKKYPATRATISIPSAHTP